MHGKSVSYVMIGADRTGNGCRMGSWPLPIKKASFKGGVARDPPKWPRLWAGALCMICTIGGAGNAGSFDGKVSEPNS